MLLYFINIDSFPYHISSQFFKCVILLNLNENLTWHIIYILPSNLAYHILNFMSRFSVLAPFLNSHDDKSGENFQYLVETWKKKGKRRTFPSRKHTNVCPDQQELPYYTKSENEVEEEEEDVDENPSEPQPQESPAPVQQQTALTQNEENQFEFPTFSLVNQCGFPLVRIYQPQISQIQRQQQQSQQAQKQHSVHIQQQQVHMPPPRQMMHSPLMPASYSTNASITPSQSQSQLASYQQQPRISSSYMIQRLPISPLNYNSSLHQQFQPPLQHPQQQQQQQQAQHQQNIRANNLTLEMEEFFLRARQNQIAQQQQRREGDANFLGIGQNYNSLNRMTQLTQTYRTIPRPASNAQPLPSSPSSLPYGHGPIQNRQVQLQLQQQQQQKQAQQVPPPIIKLYFNQYAERSLWNIIWEPEQCPNIPLILDRSDRRIKFTDVNEQRNGEQRKIRKWNDMNFEDSQFYTELYVSKDSRLNLNLRHSDPALNMSLIEPNITDFENFHHPKFDTTPFINRKLRVRYKMKYDINENGDTMPSPYLKDLKSISGRRGIVYVVEHTSEAMPFIMNVGMASRFITYWHKLTPQDYPKTNLENIHILEPDQTAPFIAQIPRNEPVPSLNCELYSVPICEHPVNNYDFLLVKSTKNPVFYIRRFNAIYCAGFLEPKQIVMRPSTKTAQDFHMDFIKAILINIFRGTEQYPAKKKITVSRIQQEYFPGVNDPKIRSVLRSFAKCKREQGSGFWEKMDTNLDQQFLSIEINPEMVCRYQSMLVGQWKLRKNGVNILTRSKRVYQQIQNLHGELTKKVAEKIETELMKTPWARTDNFTKAFQGHAVQIEHADDGSQIMRSKSRRGKGDSIDGKDVPQPSRRQLAGTDADLRSLTLRELREKLIPLGVDPSVIDEMTRWKQVDLLREFANRHKQDGNKSELTQNYSRGPRNDYAASLDAYKKQYQATFETNLSFIRSSNPVENNEQFDDGNFLDDISLQMMREDENDEDAELPSADEESRNVNPSSGDPPELVPYGICTYPTKIDWDKLGFSNTQMRTVAKLIHVSWNRNDGLHVEVHWRRSPHQIEALMKNPSDVYPDQGQKAPSTSEDLEEYILKIQHKTLLDKLRRTRSVIKKKGGKAPVQSYLTVHHQIQLVNDTGGNNLAFHLTPEILQKISEASEKFKIFEQKTGRSHSKKKKSSGGSSSSRSSNSKIAEESDEDADDNSEVTIIPQRRLGRQNPVVLFNDLLKKLLQKLLQKPGDIYYPFLKPVLKKDVPDYHNIVQNPICFEDIERKINNLEYTTVIKFFSDVKLIESNCKLYNTGRHEDLVALSATMMKDFQNEFNLMREDLYAREGDIDPILRKDQESL